MIASTIGSYVTPVIFDKSPFDAIGNFQRHYESREEKHHSADTRLSLISILLKNHNAISLIIIAERGNKRETSTESGTASEMHVPIHFLLATTSAIIIIHGVGDALCKLTTCHYLMYYTHDYAHVRRSRT